MMKPKQPPGQALSRSILLLLCLCPLAARVAAGAQTTTATISGVVLDQNGDAVPRANITVRNVQTGIRRAITCDDAGRFRMTELPPGEYETTAEQTGFSREVRTGIVLTLNRDAVLRFVLKVGSITDQVVISGDAPPVDTTTAALSNLIPRSTINDLPLNGRDLFQLTTLDAGVVNVGSLTNLQIKAGPGQTKMAINGARVNYNNFLVDGTSVGDFANTTPGSFAGAFTGVEAIREYEILAGNYSAEFGGAGGAVISLVTQSGTNQVHGSAFEFIRNSALDARNFFDLSRVPPFKRNQFGGSAGGPLIKDKTFFFAEYEGLRQRLAETTRFTVPTLEARDGILPGGNIPVSPAMKPYLDLYPFPNAGDIGGGLGFFIRSTSATTDEDHFTVRVDQEVGGGDTAFARYMFDQSRVVSPDHVIQNTENRGRNQYAALGLTHIFSPRLVGALRFGFNRSRAFGDVIDQVPIPQNLVWIPGHQRLGDFSLGFGLSPLSDNVFYPRPLTLNSFEPVAQLDYTAGAHSIRTGVTGRRIQLNALSSNAPDGAYLFSSYASFLEAKPFLFFAQKPQSDVYRGIRQWVFAAYGEDQWRASRRFTVTYGLRYETITVPTEVNGKVANFRDILHDKTATVGDPFFINPSRLDFAPRLGLAWDVLGDGKMSVRAGYGVYFAQPYPESFRYAFTNQPPFFQGGIVLGQVPFPNAFQSLGPDFIGASQIQAYQYRPATTYVMQWNLGIQAELPRQIVLTAGYVGSRGVHLVTDGNRNTSANFTVLPDGEEQYPPSAPVLRNASFAGPIRANQTDSDSFYNAWQVSLDRRLAAGFQLHVGYTFSKSIDTASDGVGNFIGQATQFAQDPYNRAAERALSVFDCRHSFSTGLIYELPYRYRTGAQGASRVPRFLLAGWQLNSILIARSGTPFTPGIGNFNNSNDGNSIDAAERPDYAPGFSGSAITGNPSHYINTSAYKLAPAGQYGNVGRNTLTGPGLFTVDLSLFKTVVRVRETMKIQFRAEAFNVLNRANFALPANTTVVTRGGVVPPNAGVITATATPSRQLQFALKLNF
jgi:hypothetical protein